MELQKTPNQLSRRIWLRDAAIAATGAVVVPSLLISCSDHKVPPGVGGPDDIPADLDLYSQAAGNAIRMAAWYQDVHTSANLGYITQVYTTLKGGDVPPAGWSGIFVDVFVKILAGILEAAVAEIPGAGAVVAVAVDQTKKWAEGEKLTRGVDAAFAQFYDGFNKSFDITYTGLLNLAKDNGNYANLREAFKDGYIDFNGKKYTLKELAQERFPERGDVPGDLDKYLTLYKTATRSFQKHLWNAIFVTAGEMRSERYFANELYGDIYTLPRNYAIMKHYPNWKATYLRGEFYTGALASNTYFYYNKYTFLFDGLQLSDQAASLLFIDDAPGNIINPDGLFSRDYVFKQFHREKPDFGPSGYDIRKDFELGECVAEKARCRFFDSNGDNYTFTRGLFPESIKK